MGLLYILMYITPVAQRERAAYYGSAGWSLESYQAYLLPKEFMQESIDEKWMREALREAEKSFRNGEIPVGAVMVKDGVVIGKVCNRKEALKDPTAHAEILDKFGA